MRAKKPTHYLILKDATMTNYVDDFQKMSQDNLESAMANAGVVSKVFQEIATESADFSKKAFEEGSATAEKLMSVKTFDKALEIQSEYAKNAFEGFVAQATKVGDQYAALAKELYKPVEEAMTKAAK